MDEETKKLLTALKTRFANMNDAERLAARDSLMEGYCPHCGSKFVPCYCQNDE